MNAPFLPEADAWIDETLASLTLEQKVGQVFFPTMMEEHLTPEEQVDNYAERLREEIDTYAPGGYYLNRYYWKSTPLLLDLMQKRSPIPMLICSDMEWGAGTGFGGILTPGFTPFPPTMATGATGFENYAYWVSFHTAIQARALGVNMIFAPVLDVNNNPKNPIINVRSYGEDPEKVTRFARASIQGFRDGEMLSCGKHFPGHGDTSEDSHLRLDVNNASRERLDQVELVPYRALIAEGALDAVMTCHIAVPALDPEANRPATVSRPILTGLLREDLGFDGVIITDALLMGGVTTVIDIPEASVQSLEAGADVLLMPPDFPKAYEGVLNAVQSGRLSEARLDESIRRILAMKCKHNLQYDAQSRQHHIPMILEDQEASSVCYTLCGNAVTVVSDSGTVLPLTDEIPMAAISCFDAVDEFFDEGQAWHDELRARSDLVIPLTLVPESDADELAAAYRLIEQNELVLVAATINVLPDKDSVALPDTIHQLIQHAVEQQKPVVLVIFGSPYVLSEYSRVDARICSFGYLPQMCAATAEVLFGERKPTGELPVTIE